MSRPAKSFTIARLNNAFLGCFSHLRSSETFDHLVRCLGTWNGSDKLFMVVQFVLKLIAPFLHLRARLQHRAGMRKTPTSSTAGKYEKLATLLGDSRTVWRFWGLLPIFQWLITLERTPPATRSLLTIERLQGWSMLLYYPLEHLSYLGFHGIVPSSFTLPISPFPSKQKTVTLDPVVLSRWSCRFWASYVVLQFFHLFEDRKLLLQRNASMRRSKNTGLTKEEKEEMKQRWDTFWSELVVNLSYFPLTIHWSLEKGLFTDEAWVGVFGLIAAVASFRTGWRATALPLPPSDVHQK